MNSFGNILITLIGIHETRQNRAECRLPLTFILFGLTLQLLVLVFAVGCEKVESFFKLFKKKSDKINVRNEVG